MALTSPAVAVMVAVPSFSAVTLILFAVTSMEFVAISSADAMEMMSVSSVLQTTVWLAPAGATLAASVIVSSTHATLLAESEPIVTPVGAEAGLPPSTVIEVLTT